MRTCTMPEAQAMTDEQILAAAREATPEHAATLEYAEDEREEFIECRRCGSRWAVYGIDTPGNRRYPVFAQMGTVRRQTMPDWETCIAGAGL